MNSIWSETAKSPEFNALDGDIKTDVLMSVAALRAFYALTSCRKRALITL